MGPKNVEQPDGSRVIDCNIRRFTNRVAINDCRGKMRKC
ncbi:hypothetical protein ANCCAN_06562 [Ancylostoma caninum]|uniref:Uncharacterized protein n=1 Tax=Ancylostoma caninum TaxID=29170 RepID=A0A368GSR4_ANCCA|nr:hypothetical protein ANCCAN_06562 [Ancylostoma caninum]